jgi:hypothetical protein
MLETHTDGGSMIREELQHLAIDIDQLHPHPRNVRQGDIGAISESLKSHGQYRAVVYQESTKRILAGNHTWKAAKALGWKEIAATSIVCDDEQALRILLADNRSSDLATYDDKELMELLQEIANTNHQLEGTLFDGDDLDDLVFKLEGSLGFVGEGLSINELKDTYENAEIRNLSLPYDREQIEVMKKRLTKLMETTGAASFSQVVWELVDKAS